jgi:outer membrane murein-binding lipoprotein Lpp
MDPQLRELLHTLLRWTLTFVLPLAVLNGALVGGQWLCHRGDRAKVEELRASLDLERQRITLLERELKAMMTSLGESEQRAARLREEIESIERRYTSGLPEPEFESYTEKVARFNEAARIHNSTIDRFESARQEYETTIAAYNERVEEANALAKTAGTTFYLIPVPGGGRHSQAHASK